MKIRTKKKNKNKETKKSISFMPPEPTTPKPPLIPVGPSPSWETINNEIEEARKKLLYSEAEQAATEALRNMKKDDDPIVTRIRAYADTIWPESIRAN